MLGPRSEVGTRRFSSPSRRITPTLRPYNMAAAPVAQLAATVYPVEFARIPYVRNLGLTADYARAFAISSADSSGTKVGTTWQSFDVAATARIPVSNAFVANVSLGYGGDDFQFDSNLPSASAELPSVSYRFVRAAAEARYAILPSLTAFGGGSYLDILSTGAIAALFPRESVGGVEGHLGASYLLARNWAVSLQAAYTRFFYSVNPVMGDSTVAGGALDEQVSVLGAVAYVL